MATFDTLGNPILSYGATGGEVSWLKQVMNWWQFYDPGHPDAQLGANVYGWDLAEAVLRFQQAYGLNPTGVADASTWWAIDQLSRGVPGSMLQPQTALTPQPGSSFTAAPYGQNTAAPTGNTDGQGGLNSAGRDALARLSMLLSNYGLSGMEGWIKDKLVNGSSEAEITLELYEQPAFKARFPVIDARRAKGLTPVNVAQVLEYEQRGREIMRIAGLTSAQFTSSDYLQSLMGLDVSLSELSDRINEGLVRVQSAPPEVRVAFGSYFGTTGDAALAQLFLDPNIAVPELEKMASTAVAGGVGARFGLQLAKGIAAEIADTGASDQAIWQGFAQLDTLKSLFEETISETTDLTAENQGVKAVFNTGPDAANTLERRALTRANQFRGGGNAAASERGVMGLGVADN